MSQPTSPQPRRSWSRIASEGATIVASILLAFSIDAWWDGRQDRKAVTQALEAVRTETTVNLDRLKASVEHHRGIVEAIGIAQQQGSTLGVQDTAVIDVEVYEPQTGALDTLISTGLLGRIDDPGLRIGLGGLTELLNDLRERESRAVDFRDAARHRIASIGDPIWNREDSDRIQSDVQVLNLLTMRQAEELDAIDSARRLEQHLEELLDRLASLP